MFRITIVAALFSILALSGEVFAQNEALISAANSYEDGIAAYYDGDFEGALEAFLNAEASGYRSGQLLYNIGNTYFRLNRLGMAILYYERAKLLMPGDELLNHSARIAQRKTSNRMDRIPRPFWGKWWDTLVANVGPVWMYFVGLCFYLTAAVFLGVRIWTGSRNDWLRRGVALCLLGSLPFLGAAFVASHGQATYHSAVVIELQSELKVAPTSEADAETIVHEGLVVRVLSWDGEWVKVRLPDGNTGWLAENVVEEV